MPQPATFIDAPAGETVVHGSQKITFAAAGILVAEEITFDKGSRSVDYANEVTDFGSDSESAYSLTKGTGSMTVQMKTAVTLVGVGDTFTFVHPGNVVIPCYVTGVGTQYRHGDVTKLPIQFAERLANSPWPKLNFLDTAGSFDTATACGAIRFSRPDPDSNGLVLQQRFRQRRGPWAPLPMNSIGPYGGGPFYLVEETELEDTKVAGIVEWDRVYATLPSGHSIAVSVTKNYQAAQYIIDTLPSPDVVVESSVVGWTQTIKATKFFDYYLDSGSVPAMPTVPSLVLIKYFSYQVLSDLGTAFPTRLWGDGLTIYDNNYASSFIGGSVDKYMGKMMVRTRIYG